ncbi:MAG: redox-sensitive transcriptional activator SoxR [Actinomycetia bacterium]|nr:redox-sensitive transcriptional activator SoxR [Actinomycetes bacterium]
MTETLTIGEVARRSGVATSALRYYEDRGLIASERTGGNQRRYQRSVLRTVSVIKAAQQVGVSLDEIATALEGLPGGRSPTKADWSKLADGWRSSLDSRIQELEALRDDLSDCIGCGCLSLRSCALFNPADQAGEMGTGARYIVGDSRPEPAVNEPR